MTARILIAEDDPLFLELIELELRENGVEVRTASNGRQAIEMIRQELPDLLLLDLMMPGTDGVAVLDFIHHEKIRLPVIILSGALGDYDDGILQKFSLRDCIEKSTVEDGKLWIRIRQHLSN